MSGKVMKVDKTCKFSMSDSAFLHSKCFRQPLVLYIFETE